jgi:predicted amidophosphoribosyltransferase
MKKACRDCGNQLEVNARGCPHCARNVQAEQMIDRFIWQRLVPLLILVVLIAAGAIFLLRR